MPHKTLYSMPEGLAQEAYSFVEPWTWKDRADVGSRTQPVETCHCNSI